MPKQNFRSLVIKAEQKCQGITSGLLVIKAEQFNAIAEFQVVVRSLVINLGRAVLCQSRISDHW